MNIFKQRKINKLLKKASKQRDLYKAIEKYMQVLSIDDKLPAIYNYIALCYFELNDYKEAEEFFKKSINNFNEDFNSKEEVYYNLAFTLHSQGKNKEAEEFYKKAIEINKNYSFTYKNYAYLLFSEKRYKESLGMFNKYTNFVEDAETYNNIAIIYEELNNEQKAIEFYEKAISTDSEYALAYNNLGVLYMTNKDYKKAAELFDKAIEKDSSLCDAYNNLASINIMFKKYNLALELFKKALILAPYQKSIRLNIAQSYYYLNDINNTVLHLKELIKLNYPVDSILSHEDFSKIPALKEKLQS